MEKNNINKIQLYKKRLYKEMKQDTYKKSLYIERKLCKKV